MAEIEKPDFSFLWAEGGATIAPSEVKIKEGWTAEIPPHQWENYYQNKQDQAIAYYFQHGIPAWDNKTEYIEKKSFVWYNDKVYWALRTNTNKDPNNNPLDWKETLVNQSIEDLGTAALVDVGLGNDDVPQNKDLGTAALVDVGLGNDDVPQNKDLGTAAYQTTATNTGNSNTAPISQKAATDAIKDLSGVTNKTGARNNLGLGTAATRDVATNAQALAGTAGVLPDAAGVHAAFKQFGYGGQNPNDLALNCNDLLAGLRSSWDGVTESTAVSLNLPALGGSSSNPRAWNVECFGRGTARLVQEATEVLGVGTIKGRTFIRVKHDATWHPWSEITQATNLQQTTGQSTQYPMSQKAVTDNFAQLSGGDDADFAVMPKVGGVSLGAQIQPISKLDPMSPCFTKTGAQTLSIKAGTTVITNGTPVHFASNTPVSMPSLTAGEDYSIWVHADGTIEAVADPFSSPASAPGLTAAKIGGFHYGLVSPGETVASGGFSTSGVTSAGGSMAWSQTDVDRLAGINEFSIWDLSWHCRGEQRGMTYNPVVNAWCAIYFASTNVDLNGISAYNTDVASGTVLPYIPEAWGGNGSLKYSAMRFYEAQEMASSLGLRLPTYAEFMSFAFGVNEGVSLGGAASTIPATIRQPGFTSHIGVEQATGHVWCFGQPNFASGSGYSAAGRGSFYASVGLSLFGGLRTQAGNSGSRAGRFDDAPSNSGWYASLRAAGDHVNLVIGAR